MRLEEINPILYSLLLAFSYFVIFTVINFFLLKNNDLKTPIIGAIIFSMAYLILQKILKIRIEKKIKK
ncbi:MAG: hypothetical protein GKC00_01440 [Candidatus Methanofastidiosa archaeon]|nr:hypothetical protein [Candidatus Methanofastidiosa archaeon]